MRSGGGGEPGEGLLPVGGGLPFDQVPGSAPLGRGLAAFLSPFSGALVLDVSDRQPQQLHGRLGRGEVPAVLGDLPQLVVQRLDTVRGVDHLP